MHAHDVRDPSNVVSVYSQLVERRTEAITSYNKSRPVDEPLVATLSADGKWVVAVYVMRDK